jgi:hypothetical protein
MLHRDPLRNHLEELARQAAAASVSLYQLVLTGEGLVHDGLWLIEYAKKAADRVGLDVKEDVRRALIRIRSELATLVVNMFPEEVLEPEDVRPDLTAEVGQ